MFCLGIIRYSLLVFRYTSSVRPPFIAQFYIKYSADLVNKQMSQVTPRSVGTTLKFTTFPFLNICSVSKDLKFVQKKKIDVEFLNSETKNVCLSVVYRLYSGLEPNGADRFELNCIKLNLSRDIAKRFSPPPNLIKNRPSVSAADYCI